MVMALINQWKFIPTPLEEGWGLYVTSLGSMGTPSDAPASGWRLHYLVRGEAQLVLPGRRGQLLEAGDVVLLGQGRLVPLAPRGCSMHVVDFAGAWMETWLRAGFFGTLPKVIRAGFDEDLLGLWLRLVEMARNPPQGAGLLMAGLLGNLLARLEVAGRTGGADSRRARLVQKALRLLCDPEGDSMDLPAAAHELGVSYSWFRRSFAAHTGMAPQRFRMSQRLDRACQLLADSELAIRAISEELGFSSQAYFARMFRKETGLSPSVWRAKHARPARPQ